ncbi:uncharacterized protein SPSC_05322 [Sporisorium scitamineum]|uniref:Transmembrane protein n=1 Tax=Sporisorium scitamineum TaxID=49012 RepID=A0A0F7S4B4_9BASI|nr:uncharacterized protein SPSC_05322 [Sporisorium scitamineum]CDW97762.1 hypothetical protein [Sporisorium scitamineum]
MRSFFLTAVLAAFVVPILFLLFSFQPCKAAAVLAKRADRDDIDLTLRLGQSASSLQQGSTSSPASSPATPLRAESSFGPITPVQAQIANYGPFDASALEPIQGPSSSVPASTWTYEKSHASVFEPLRHTARARISPFQAAIQDAVRQGTYRRQPFEQLHPPPPETGVSTSANTVGFPGHESQAPLTLSGKAIEEANTPTRQTGFTAPAAVVDTTAIQQTNDALRQALGPRPILPKPRKGAIKSSWMLVNQGKTTIGGAGQPSGNIRLTPSHEETAAMERERVGTVAAEQAEEMARKHAEELARLQAMTPWKTYLMRERRKEIPRLIHQDTFFPEAALKLQSRIKQVSLAISSLLKDNDHSLTNDEQRLLGSEGEDWEKHISDQPRAKNNFPIEAPSYLKNLAAKDMHLLQDLESLLVKLTSTV